MAGVSVLRLDRAKGGGLVGREDNGEFFCGLVTDGLSDEVGEGHILNELRVDMRVAKRVFSKTRSSDSPIE